MKSTWYNIVDENKNNNKINTFKTEQAEAQLIQVCPLKAKIRTKEEIKEIKSIDMSIQQDNKYSLTVI